MKYKISVNLNRIPEGYKVFEDFEKARAYHLKHGVELEFVFKNVDVRGYTSYHQTAPLDRWLIGGAQLLVRLDPAANADMFVFDQAEWANPPGSQFPLKPNTPNGSCFIEGSKPFINIGTYIAEHANGQTWIQIAHEIMHALRFSANQAGFPIQDVMDTYREDANPDSSTGNFAEQWALLKPYLKSLQSPPSLSIPKVVVTRAWDDGTQYLGDLAFGDFKCKTVELPWKLNVPNISCIPRGLYTCKWTWSFRFLRYTYEVQNVSGRRGIRIHPANFFFDLKGCIALGDKYGDLNHDKWADLINSKETISKFEQLMNKRPFQLIIA